MHHHSFEHFSALLAFLSRPYSFMDSQQSPCVVPSNAPAPQVSKSTSRIRQRASFTGSTQNSVAGNGLQIQERRRQRQKAIPANTELRSERYIAYRRKQRGGDKKAQREQKWDDDVEEAFQLGMLENMNCLVCLYLSCTSRANGPQHGQNINAMLSSDLWKECYQAVWKKRAH